jgi:hypothetical protein
MFATVRRRDISVAEEREVEYGRLVTTWWEAELRGPLSSGESVNLARTGSTFADALKALETAIEENGWGIR